MKNAQWQASYGTELPTCTERHLLTRNLNSINPTIKEINNMEIKIIPEKFVKYLDTDVLLLAFSELVRRKDFESLRYMKNQLENPFEFPNGLEE